MKCIKILIGLITVLALTMPCLAGVEYHKDPTGYSEGDQVELKVYIHELSDELRLKVRKIDGGDFWADGRMRFYRDGQQIDSVLYYSGQEYVDTEIPLAFTLETHEFQARADSFDGSGNQFWTGTVDVWGEWEAEEPQLSDHLAGDEFENEYYDENSSNPNVYVEEGNYVEVLVNSDFDLHSDGSNVEYRFWRSPELEFTDINSSVSRVTLHSYVDLGIYYVTAYAGNGDGKIDSDTIEVCVTEPTPPSTNTPTATATPTPTPEVMDLNLLISGPTGSGHTELHTLQGPYYQENLAQIATFFWCSDLAKDEFQLIDWNHDGHLDLVAIAVAGPTGSGKVEVHILAGPNFDYFLLHSSSIFNYGNLTRDVPSLIDWNDDGILDLAFIAVGPTGSGKIEIHIADGATYFQSFLCQVATVFACGDLSRDVLQLVDWNGDGIEDLAAIPVFGPTGSGGIEVHIADGSTLFQSFICQTDTVFGYGDLTRDVFQLADYNLDGRPDLCLVATEDTGSGMLEVHVLDGNSLFQNFLNQSATAWGYGDLVRNQFQFVDWN